MGSWLERRRAMGSVRKRKRAAATGANYSIEVTHALDFFIWSALEDTMLHPVEPRPFGDDERYYNEVINRLLDNDMPSTADETEMRIGDPLKELIYGPNYFPDEWPNPQLSAAKHEFVMLRFREQCEKLRVAASDAKPLSLPPTFPSEELLVCPEAYPSFYRGLIEGGRLFSQAKPEEREAMCVSAMEAAVIPPPGDPERQLESVEGWYVVSYKMAREFMGDFLDPEGLLPGASH